MRYYRISIVAGLLALGLIAGCDKKSPEPSPSAAPPQPAPTVTVTATPTSTPVMSTENEEPGLRVTANFPGATKVEFTVKINDQVVGNFNASAETDLSSRLRDGDNSIEVSWTADPEMLPGSGAQLFVETRQAGESEWNTLMSRQVGPDTAAGSSEITLAGDPEANLSPVPTEGSLSPSPSTTSEDSMSANVYSVKVKQSRSLPTEFNLTLNGKQIGSYAGDTDKDITNAVVDGENKGTLSYKVQATGRLNTAVETEFTLGVQSEGKWSTVVSQTVTSRNPEGVREFTFQAGGPR